MASPTRQDGTEPAESWIHRLPLDIRTDIAQLGARGLGWRQPIPVTRAHLRITELFLISEDSVVNDTLPPEYRLRAFRTREQHEALQTWLTLCNKARTAALVTEIFVLNVLTDTSIFIRSIAEDYTKVYLDAASPQPQLPLFEGAARDLVLNLVDYKVGALELFPALRAVFGANLRRIHVLEAEHNDILLGMKQIASTQTDRVYFFHPKFGKPNLGMERILKTAFCKLGEPLGGETNELGVEVREGEFDDQDAKVFEFPSLPELCYGEIIRQHGNGETRINKGVKDGLREGFNGCPSVAAKCFLGQVVRLAEKYFAQLEYVSLCGPISNPALEAQELMYNNSLTRGPTFNGPSAVSAPGPNTSAGY